MSEAIAADVELERSLRNTTTGCAAAVEGTVPTIDLTSADAAEAIWAAATTVGFFSVTNHGIDEALIDRCFASSAGFFARELTAKKGASPFAPQLNSGYEFMTQVRPSTSTADQKESLQITARQGCMDGRWPTEPARLEPDARLLMDAAHALGCRLLNLIEPLACPSICRPARSRPRTACGAMTASARCGFCTTRRRCRPTRKTRPSGARARTRTGAAARCSSSQRPGDEGLEMAANPRAGGDGGWVAVNPVPGGIAVNIGDMLSRWSAGRLLSNLHRVRMPTAAECQPPRSRFSMAFFMQADKRALISSDREGDEDITAGDYILGRIKSNFVTKHSGASFASTNEAKRQKA